MAGSQAWVLSHHLFSGRLVISKLFWLLSNSISLGQCVIISLVSLLPAIIQTDQTPQMRNEKPCQEESPVLKDRYQSPSLLPRNSWNFPTCANENYFLSLEEFLHMNSPLSAFAISSSLNWTQLSKTAKGKDVFFTMPWPWATPQASLPFRKT